MNQDAFSNEHASVEPDLPPPGSRACFIFTQERGLEEKPATIFEYQGYHTATADDPGQGVAKLGLNRYDVAVLEHKNGTSCLLEEINAWPSITRRSMNLINIGDEAPSMHQSRALIMGADFYLNLQDRDSLEDPVMQCLRGYQLYHHPWHKVLEEMDAK